MSNKTKIAIASDHAGFELKQAVVRHLGADNVLDLGANNLDSVDYPDFGYAVGKALEEGNAEQGIVICGSGIGISIAANRNPAVRAALCMNTEMAKLARQHNDANVLALGARLVDEKTALDIVNVFFKTEFEGGRHARRVEKLNSCC
ncbi:MAG TPA: ribose 5-phosphate isomerase B [Alphaproteobacteria bacterium]|nr:ribose 5-phosphate isomerase B [Micavibrio sp.]HQX27195.1 ribose 5-phosphate isomerase B [Alphaproteobacteria bacterium]